MGNNNDNIILKGAASSAIGAGFFFCHEAFTQRQIIRAPQEKASAFINSIANEKLREKYNFIRDNFNSSNTKNALAAKTLAKDLKRMSALGGALFGGIIFMGCLSFKSFFPNSHKN